MKSFEQNGTISVIIPARDEAATIGALIGQLKRCRIIQEIIVVNDGSMDETAKKAQEAGATVLSHVYSRGNGAAVKTGVRNARGEILVLMDGDGQHDPDEVEKMIQALPGYDMVVGARKMRQHANWARGLANQVYSRFASYVSNFQIQDLTSGFRVIRRRVLMKFLYLLPNTFSYPTTITMALIRAGYGIRYLPVEIRARQASKSKIRIVRDGLRFFLIITKVAMLFSPLRVFLPISMFFGSIAMARYAYSFFDVPRLSNIAALLGMTSVLIFMLGLIAEQIATLRMDRSEDGF